VVRWNVKIYLKEIVCESVDWIQMAQYRDQWHSLVTTVMKIRFA
jgi:hypothetical protein